jgi:hypothetical protein
MLHVPYVIAHRAEAAKTSSGGSKLRGRFAPGGAERVAVWLTRELARVAVEEALRDYLAETNK